MADAKPTETKPVATPFAAAANPPARVRVVHPISGDGADTDPAGVATYERLGYVVQK